MINILLAATMMTVFGEKVTADNAWREYPRPQLVRDNWACLNGEWDYKILSPDKEGWAKEKAAGKILVPFCIESALSGVGRLTDKDELIEYRRTFKIAPQKGFRQILRFDGVDFRTQVFVNGIEAGIPHEGAQSSFSYDITSLVKSGENDLLVRVWDPTEGFVNSLGKQSLKPKGCFYTRVSGIWKTVWLEQVPKTWIESYNVIPDIDNGKVDFVFNVKGVDPSEDVEIEIFDSASEKTSVVIAKGEGDGGERFSVKMPKSFRLWSPEEPNLYNFKAKCGSDEIRGYFAMRKFTKGKDKNSVLRFFLNNKPYFIIGTLDQGWWPDGLLTPPSEDAMIHDIATLKKCGYNMMRKHIKVEPMRYYYLCDKLGILVIQDMPSGDGSKLFNFSHANFAYGSVRREWKNVMDNLMAVPSIIMWVPYNEQWTQPCDILTHDMLRWTSQYDPSHRLVNGPSGWRDFEGGDKGHGPAERAWSKHKGEGEAESCDVIDRHDYNFRPTMHAVNPHRVSLLGEYGGIGCRVPGHLWTENAWGYGATGNDTDRAVVQKKYVELTSHVTELAKKGLAGAVYTQTTDVEAEINGIMTYDRKVLKFDPVVLKKAHDLLRAAVE